MAAIGSSTCQNFLKLTKKKDSVEEVSTNIRPRAMAVSYARGKKPIIKSIAKFKDDRLRAKENRLKAEENLFKTDGKSDHSIETMRQELTELKERFEDIKLGWEELKTDSEMRDLVLQYDAFIEENEPCIEGENNTDVFGVEAFTPFCAERDRYQNVKSIKRTRVVGPWDYLNANKMLVGNDLRLEYIASQSPKEISIADHWKMIFEYNSEVSIMLTNFEENGREKSSEYFPRNVKLCRASVDAPSFMGRAYGEKKVSDDEFSSTNPEVMVSCTSIAAESWGRIYRFDVRIFDECDFWAVKKHTIVHYTNWMDHSAPNLKEFLEMRKVAEQEVKKANAGPPIIHCSAGVGRTGTYILINSVVDKILGGEGSGDSLLEESLREIRDQRNNFMVIGEVQLLFAIICIEKIVSDEITKRELALLSHTS